MRQGCKKTGGSFKITSINYVIDGCTGLQTAVKTSPVAIAVDSADWSLYGSGIFNKCSTNLDHAVLLVGIVSGNWKIKNSWGAKWGENGYIRLAAGNTCGICNLYAVFPQ